MHPIDWCARAAFYRACLSVQGIAVRAALALDASGRRDKVVIAVCGDFANYKLAIYSQLTTNKTK